MGYTAIQVPFRKARFRIPSPTTATTTMVNPTKDLKDLPQLMNPQQALQIINYVPTSDSRLVKRKGLSKIFTVAGVHKVTLLQQYTDDVWIFGYEKTTAAYRVSTNTVTNIKTNWPTNFAQSGVRYGDYFFVCNGSDVIYRISQTLSYGTQTANFTVGKTLTGSTSNAQALILEDADAGATGVLTLGNIVGVFQNGEIITDTSGGSATTTSTVGFTITAVSGSPMAKVLKAIGPRLYAGNTNLDNTEVRYSAVDDGTNPPFTNWVVGTGAADPGQLNYRNVGACNAIDSLGANVIVLAEKGKWAFTTTTTDSGGTLVKVDNVVMQRIDMGGSRATVSIPKGMFYVNKGGIWQLASIGQSNVPFSVQETEASTILGIEYFRNLDLTNADFTYDAVLDTLFLTCARDSDTNNLIIAYNLTSGAFAEFSGWNINRFMNINQVVYGGSSLSTTVYKCFDTDSDDGTDIWTTFYQELKMGDLETRQELLQGYVDAFLSPSSRLLVCFDIYDVQGNFVPNKLCFLFDLQNGNHSAGGWGVSGWGSSGFAGHNSNASGTLVECFDGFGAGHIRNFQRIRIKITEHSKVPHSLVWIKAQAEPKINIRRRKMQIIT